MADLQALPPGVAISPFWDFAIEGVPIPVWLVIMFVIMFIMVATNMWWIYKYFVMRPVQGHGIAARSGNEKTQQVLSFGLNRAFSIQALDYMEKVLSFRDPTRVARWLQTSPYAVGMFGYKSIMLISEIFDHPKDPVAEMAIGIASREHNESITDMKEMITDYDSFRDHRDVLEHENPEGIKVPIYALYDPAMIHQYTPKNRTAGQFGGTILKDASDLNMSQQVKTFWEKHMQLMICVIFAIIIIALTYMFVTSGAANPAPKPPVPIPGVGT
jgi:hypothetical protein